MRLERRDVLTVPNLLTLLRLLLIIPIVIAILQEQFLTALILTVLSGLTDVIDGIIARKFNQVSDLGKIIDPIADKLTQAALILCLCKKHRAMLAMIISFIVREGVVGFFSAYTFKKTNKVTSSRWYGKINTVIIYGVMCALLLFPRMNPIFAEGAIWFSTVLMQFSLIGYVLYYISRLRAYEAESCTESSEETEATN